MSVTEQMEATAKLRWLMRDEDVVLQQWWSNAMNVRMGPAQMIKGEWRDVEVVGDLDE
jgi:hypothetical protein